MESLAAIAFAIYVVGCVLAAVFVEWADQSGLFDELAWMSGAYNEGVDKPELKVLLVFLWPMIAAVLAARGPRP